MNLTLLARVDIRLIDIKVNQDLFLLNQVNNYLYSIYTRLIKDYFYHYTVPYQAYGR